MTERERPRERERDRESKPRMAEPSRAADTTPEPVRPRELEPVPKAFEEDENEEVGRPEGPFEERRVDPYSWESRPADTEPALPDWIASVPRRPAGPAEPMSKVSADEGDGEEREAPPDRPAGSEDKPGGQTRSSFGRRPGRGRRR